MASLRYSREFETEADDYAMALLASKHISTEYFAMALERLLNRPSKSTDEGESYLSSHPNIRARIERVRNNGERYLFK